MSKSILEGEVIYTAFLLVPQGRTPRGERVYRAPITICLSHFSHECIAACEAHAMRLAA